MEEERKPLESRNFIDAFIEEDIAPGGQFEGLRHTESRKRSCMYCMNMMNF